MPRSRPSCSWSGAAVCTASRHSGRSPSGSRTRRYARRLVSEGFELGRIVGIRIGIHWSWLVVFVLITWTLADSVFPNQNPGLSDSSYLAMAVAAAVLFFTSLLLHELGHALQARREG